MFELRGSSARVINEYPNIESNNRLLFALAEEMKLPFVQIARSAELGKTTEGGDYFNQIEATAEAALRILDSYVLSAQVLAEQTFLPLESVPVTAVLYDTAEKLHSIARLYDAPIDIRVRGRCGLVMANKTILQAALTSLAYSFINSNNSKTKRQIVLSAKRSGKSIVAGVASASKALDRHSLIKAKKVYGGQADRPGVIAHGQGAGLYVADALFGSMNSGLRFSSTKSEIMLSGRLLSSEQLSLL